jgi:putative tryptophan/tyrosine transport system substrate-binding protein
MKKAAVPSILVAVILLTVAMTAQAQQPGRIFRIGYLDPVTVSDSSANLETFRQELSKLGWIEGKNLVFEYRFAELKTERLPELAAELVRLKVDLIVTSGNPPALAAQKATSTIPIVMMGVADPLALGLVASLARPGGNITGFALLSPELNTKRLEVLKDAVPKLDRVGLLKRSESNPGEEIQLEELRVAASALKVKLEEIKTQLDAQGLESAFKNAKQKQVKAIMTTALRSFTAERKRIVELAAKYRLPGMYSNKGYVDEGGLMFYGVDSTDRHRRAAGYVDKILKGAKPADLPVQQPTKFEFIINLMAAKQIGLTIPPEVLARANEVRK